jgi:hypothetical protein
MDLSFLGQHFSHQCVPFSLEVCDYIVELFEFPRFLRFNVLCSLFLCHVLRVHNLLFALFAKPIKSIFALAFIQTLPGVEIFWNIG